MLLGDEGKGTTIDSLTRQHKVETIFRFNGGCQSAHHVVPPNGNKWHCFSQVGSGMLSNPDVKTVLTEDFLVDPLALRKEIEHLGSLGVKNVWDKIFISPHAKLVTPFHRAVNRLIEASRGENCHGSCGLGIGETVAQFLDRPEISLTYNDLWGFPSGTLQKITRIQEYCRYKVSHLAVDKKHPEWEWLTDPWQPEVYINQFWTLRPYLKRLSDKDIWSILSEDTILFEGSQGVLLDQDYGFHPHTTWSKCTFDNATSFLKKHNYEGKITKLGVIRSYMTRHGAGPLPTESKELTKKLPETHNCTHPWQGKWRVGYFDLPLFKYAVKCCKGIDGLVVTHLDKRPKKFCDAYKAFGNKIVKMMPLPQNIDDQEWGRCFLESLDRNDLRFVNCLKESKFLKILSDAAKCPIIMKSYGPTWQDKVYK